MSEKARVDGVAVLDPSRLTVHSFERVLASA
jgi:hypothetical protein